MRRVLIILSLLTLLGCAALSKGWNDNEIRAHAQYEARKVRDFVSATTGNAIAGAASGSAVALLVLVTRGWKKKDPK